MKKGKRRDVYCKGSNSEPNYLGVAETVSDVKPMLIELTNQMGDVVPTVETVFTGHPGRLLHIISGLENVQGMEDLTFYSILIEEEL